eukprot:363400-Chlamydomonas_euryale.AAC.11
MEEVPAHTCMHVNAGTSASVLDSRVSVSLLSVIDMVLISVCPASTRCARVSGCVCGQARTQHAAWRMQRAGVRETGWERGNGEMCVRAVRKGSGGETVCGAWKARAEEREGREEGGEGQRKTGGLSRAGEREGGEEGGKGQKKERGGVEQGRREGRDVRRVEG